MDSVLIAFSPDLLQVWKADTREVKICADILARSSSSSVHAAMQQQIEVWLWELTQNRVCKQVPHPNSRVFGVVSRGWMFHAAWPVVQAWPCDLVRFPEAIQMAARQSPCLEARIAQK